MQIKKPSYWNKKNIISFTLYPLTLITYLINFIKSFSIKKKYYLKKEKQILDLSKGG